MRSLVLITALFATPIYAQDCPPAQDFSAEQTRLHAELLAANNEMSARIIGGRLWAMWSTAPNEAAQTLLDRGLSRLRAYDFETAEGIFDELVTYCPNYAEGYNQRAYAKFLRQNYGASLDDLAETLMREPKHFGALAGRALVLMNMGRTKLGQKALKEALKVNPWLSERSLLVPEQEI